MSKQVLSIEQMQHLKELGVDTSMASALYCIDNETGEKQLMWNEQVEETDKDDEYFRIVPAYTLQDILDLLPDKIEDEEGYNNTLSVDKLDKVWNLNYGFSDDIEPLISFESYELIDAAYEMLCWCIENGCVETKK